MKNKTRSKLLTAILELSCDEFTTIESVTKLAKKSNTELIDNLINIATYYQTQTNK